MAGWVSGLNRLGANELLPIKEPQVRILHPPLLWRGVRVVYGSGLENRRGIISLRGFESHPLLYKLNIRVYGVMVTSHLAMVEFRVRFPIDAYRDRHSNPMDNVMICKIKS